MRHIVGGLLVLTFAACGGKGCVNATVLSHDPRKAADVAARYGTAAFVEGDLDRAYSFVAEQARSVLTPQAQREVLQGMHPKTRPVSISATAFEPVPGQAAIQIFLEGRNGDESFYYRVFMTGTDAAGYKVAAIYRGSGPYPPSSLRQSL